MKRTSWLGLLLASDRRRMHGDATLTILDLRFRASGDRGHRPRFGRAADPSGFSDPNDRLRFGRGADLLGDGA